MLLLTALQRAVGNYGIIEYAVHQQDKGVQTERKQVLIYSQAQMICVFFEYPIIIT